MFLKRSNSAGSCKSSGHGHHHAAVIALSDLDKALNLEEELFCENRGDGKLETFRLLEIFLVKSLVSLVTKQISD